MASKYPGYSTFTDVPGGRFRSRLPIENPANPGTNPDLESGGGWGDIVIVNIIERIAQKLHLIILLHFQLVTFRIHFRNLQSPSFV